MPVAVLRQALELLVLLPIPLLALCGLASQRRDSALAPQGRCRDAVSKEEVVSKDERGGAT